MLNRILLFGGGFNPIHNAHLLCAREAMEQSGCTEVIFIPSGNPPHKTELLPFEHRLEMVKLAIRGEPYFDFSAFEGGKGEKTYTVDTVRHFWNSGFREISWLIGEDWLDRIPKWRSFPDLCSMCNFVCLSRPGYDKQVFLDALPKEAAVKLVRVSNPVLEISSTQIRKRLKERKSISFLVPDAVRDYLRSNNLYQ